MLISDSLFVFMCVEGTELCLSAVLISAEREERVHVNCGKEKEGNRTLD